MTEQELDELERLRTKAAEGDGWARHDLAHKLLANMDDLLRAARAVAAMKRWGMYAAETNAGTWHPIRVPNEFWPEQSEEHRNMGWPSLVDAILAAAEWLEREPKP